MKQIINKLYRYEIVYPDPEDERLVTSPDTATIELIKYDVLKITPQGFWIPKYNKKRWVSNSSRKRFAYPTKKEALNYFIKRKQSYIGYMNFIIRMNKEAIELAKKELTNKY